MKKERKKRSSDESQIRFGIQDAEPMKLIFIEKRKTSGALVANHPTFGVAGGTYCTGPPGRARSPGSGRKRTPDHPPNNKAAPDASPLSTRREGQGVSQNRLHFYNTEYQFIMNKNKIQFITNIKFLKIMKKQILILAFFVLAMMAGTVNSFGQTAVHHNYPKPLTCDNDALHPIAGKAYTYDVGIDAPHDGGNFTWWATKDPNFLSTTLGVTTTNMATTKLTTATGLLATNPEYATTTKKDSTIITWSGAILNGTSYQGADVTKSPTFVAVQYQPGATSTFCSDNLKIFELNPVNGFTVDIKNIANEKVIAGALAAADTLAFGATEDQCVDLVRLATYNATDKGIDYDFGTNILYYEVIAANFSGTFTPSFKIDGLQLTQEAKIEWDYSLAFTTPVTVIAAAKASDNGSGLTGTPFASPSTVTTNATNTAIGVSIYVRVTVSNKTFETLAVNPLTISVDAETQFGNYDVINGTAADDCSTAAADFIDNSTQDIKARPTVTNTIPLIIPANPGNYIPKN